MPRDAATQPDISQLVQVPPPFSNIAAPPLQSYPLSPDPFLRTPIPPTQWMQPDNLRQFYQLGNPQNRIGPLAANAQAAINSTAKGVSTTVATTIVNNAIANIPAAAAVSDGLAHGDAVWVTDSAYTSLRDDFMYSTTSSGGIGETRWTVGTTGGVLKAWVGNFNNPGILQLFSVSTTSALPGTPGTTNGTGQATNIFPQIGGVPNSFWDATWPVFDYPGWKMTWVFGLSRGYNPAYGGTNSGMPAFLLTKLAMYVGMGNSSTSGTNAFINDTRPPIFFGCRFDTDTTAPSIGDTTFWLEACMNPPTNVNARNNIQGTGGGVFNTGVVPVEGVFYRLDMVYVAAGQLQMTLSGNGATVSHTFTLTQMSQLYKSSGNIPINSNGITNVNFANPNTFTTTTGYVPQGPGGKLTMSGWTGTNSPLNGTFTLLQTQGAIQTIFTPVGYVTPFSQATITVVGYPAILPIATMGNTTEAAQNAINTRALNIDFWSFISNGGLRGATTNALNSRYFN